MTDGEANRILPYLLDRCHSEAERAAIRKAENALQERLDGEKGCRWCQHFENDPQFLIGRGNGQYDEAIFKFCPVCGRKLKPAMPREEQRG